MEYYSFMFGFGLFVLLPIYAIMSLSSYFKTKEREETLREAMEC